MNEVLDKFGMLVQEGDIVEYAVYGPGPGKPYQQPEGTLRCFVVLIDRAGEIYLDPRCDINYVHVITKASPDMGLAELEESNWLLICGDPDEIKMVGKAMKF